NRPTRGMSDSPTWRRARLRGDERLRTHRDRADPLPPRGRVRPGDRVLSRSAAIVRDLWAGAATARALLPDLCIRHARPWFLRPAASAAIDAGLRRDAAGGDRPHRPGQVRACGL